MKVVVNNNESDFEARKVTIVLNENIEFEIRVNQFNELVINKAQFGDGETAMSIKPTMSNEVRLS